MPSQTNDQALEAAIGKCLTGTCLEDLRGRGITGDVAGRARTTIRAIFRLPNPPNWEIIIIL